MIRTAVLMLLASALPAAAGAQVNGPLMHQGDLEAGMVYHWIDRTISRDTATEAAFTQSPSGVAFRYGLTASATFALELAADRDVVVQDDDALYYSVGGGLQAGVWSCNGFRVTTTIFYSQSLATSDSEGADRLWEQTVEWMLTGEYLVEIGNHELTAWAGPSLSDFLVQVRSASEAEDWDSDDTLGAAFGARALLLDHLIVQGSFNWVGDVQSNLFVAWRF